MEPDFVTLRIEGVEDTTAVSMDLLVTIDDQLQSVTCPKALLQEVFNTDDPDTLLDTCNVDLTARIEGKILTINTLSLDLICNFITPLFNYF